MPNTNKYSLKAFLNLTSRDFYAVLNTEAANYKPSQPQKPNHYFPLTEPTLLTVKHVPRQPPAARTSLFNRRPAALPALPCGGRKWQGGTESWGTSPVKFKGSVDFFFSLNRCEKWGVRWGGASDKTTLQYASWNVEKIMFLTIARVISMRVF